LFKHINWFNSATVIVALFLLLPVMVMLYQAILGDSELGLHMLRVLLAEYVSNSLLLLLGVAVGVLMLALPAAWLTSMCRFPGQTWLAWALLLPMAMPAYIIAYTYTGILDFAGPVQSFIRDWTGLGYGDYWFPEVRSLGGAVVMLSLVLYPYVYLMARAAFAQQSVTSLEVGRSLGYSQWQALFFLAMPMARPAIAAGLALVMMETLADYGTVQYFGVSVFTTGIFRAFYGYGDTAATAQLATVLLVFVVALLAMERLSRRRAKYHSVATTDKRAEPIELTAGKGWLAFVLCLIPFALGFLIPVLQLTYWAVFESNEWNWDFFSLAWNSFYLACLAALLVVALALLLAYARRIEPGQPVKGVVAMAGFGYAMPGTIIAIGVLLPLAWMDQQIISWIQGLGWSSPGLLLSGSLVALLFAYSVRFIAVALSSVRAGLDSIKPSVDYAGRSLGHGPWGLLRRIHVPMMRSTVLTALLIVFVDVLKELPATLILRPFNFNTLAVRAYELAADERLVDAAPASITIVMVALIPVLVLHRAMNKRPKQN